MYVYKTNLKRKLYNKKGKKLKGPPLGLRQFLKAEIPFKNGEKCFLFLVKNYFRKS